MITVGRHVRRSHGEGGCLGQGGRSRPTSELVERGNEERSLPSFWPCDFRLPPRPVGSCGRHPFRARLLGRSIYALTRSADINYQLPLSALHSGGFPASAVAEVGDLGDPRRQATLTVPGLSEPGYSHSGAAFASERPTLNTVDRLPASALLRARYLKGSGWV